MCGCGSSNGGASEPWVVALPSGRTKSYATKPGAEAALRMYAGSTLKTRSDGQTIELAA
jgi:hypothetical protein